jgi:hypothetical protein
MAVQGQGVGHTNLPLDWNLLCRSLNQSRQLYNGEENDNEYQTNYNVLDDFQKQLNRTYEEVSSWK